MCVETHVGCVWVGVGSETVRVTGLRHTRLRPDG